MEKICLVEIVFSFLKGKYRLSKTFCLVEVPIFPQTHINKLSIFWKLALKTFFQKKMSEAIKMQNTREKQQCTWTNKMVERFNGL